MKMLQVFCFSMMFASCVYAMDEKISSVGEGGSSSGASMHGDSSFVGQERERQYATVHDLVRDAGNLTPEVFKTYLTYCASSNVNAVKHDGRLGKRVTPLDLVNEKIDAVSRNIKLSPKSKTYRKLHDNYTHARTVLIVNGACTREQLEKDPQSGGCCVS